MPCADANSYSLDTLAIAAMSKVGTDCTADYIEIPGVGGQCYTNAGVYETARLCGNIFNVNRLVGDTLPAVCDCTKPFTVRIKTNGVIDAGIAAVQRGVSI